MWIHKIKLRLFSLVVISFLSSPLFAQDYLKHYGLIYFDDESISQKLAERFKTHGKPVFFVHDLQLGVKIGDIIRFRDKVVYIDKNVWQTLKVEGVFAQLNKSPIVQIQANANSNSWRSRARSSGGKRTKKAFQIGAEILKILEDYFGKIPKNEELVIKFKGKRMVLIAPNKLLDQLPFTRVRKIKEGGTPEIISNAPNDYLLEGSLFRWQVWAIDSRDPASILQYYLHGNLPEGLVWNEEEHLIEGSTSSTDSNTVWVFAQNPKSKLKDSLKVILKFWKNEPPKFTNTPSNVAQLGYEWKFTPQVADPDHFIKDLKVEILDVPETMAWDSSGTTLCWKPDDQLKGEYIQVMLKVSDPLGANSERAFEVQVGESSHVPYFASELGGWRMQEGQTGTYKPVVIDPDGDSLVYEIFLSDNQSLQWDGERIHFNAYKLGVHSALIKVRDPQGNKAQQHVTYYVYPQKKIWTGLGIKTRLVGGLQLWELVFDRGAARAGAFSTNLERVFESDVLLIKRYWPFFFVGASLLGHRQYLKGNYFFMDFGFSLRKATKNTTVGGLMFRLDSRFKSKYPIPGYIEMEFQASAGQGIFIVNGARINSDSAGLDAFRLRYNEGLDTLATDYRDPDNLFTTFRLEGWYPIGLNFWTGPVTWRNDHPLFNQHHQRIGWGFRNHVEIQWMRAVQSLRLGFGGSSADFTAQWDLQVSFGFWD